MPEQRVSIKEILNHPFVTKYYPINDQENQQDVSNKPIEIQGLQLASKKLQQKDSEPG
jgi:hypothetical protein